MELVKSLITNRTHGDRENVTNLWFLITDQTPDDYRNQSLTTLIDEIKNLSKYAFYSTLISLATFKMKKIKTLVIDISTVTFSLF